MLFVFLCIIFMLLQNYIYFGNKQSPLIYIFDKTSLSQISSFRLYGSGGVTDMAMYAPDVQPSTTSKSVTACGLNLH